MGLQRVPWEVRGGPHRGVFLLGRRASNRLIIVYRRKKRVVGRGHIVVLEGIGCQCCFGAVGERQAEGVSLLVYRIKNKCPHLVVLFDFLNE